MKKENGFGVMGKHGTSLTGLLVNPTVKVIQDVLAQLEMTGMQDPVQKDKYTLCVK